MQQANCINRDHFAQGGRDKAAAVAALSAVTKTDRKLCKPALELKLTRQARLHRDHDVPMMHYS